MGATLEHVRQILSEHLIAGGEEFKKLTERTTDEDLLKESVEKYGFTPANYSKLLKTAAAYGIKVGKKSLRDSLFYQKPTVSNFLRLCNTGD